MPGIWTLQNQRLKKKSLEFGKKELNIWKHWKSNRWNKKKRGKHKKLRLEKKSWEGVKHGWVSFRRRWFKKINYWSDRERLRHSKWYSGCDVWNEKCHQCQAEQRYAVKYLSILSRLTMSVHEKINDPAREKKVFSPERLWIMNILHVWINSAKLNAAPSRKYLKTHVPYDNYFAAKSFSLCAFLFLVFFYFFISCMPPRVISQLVLRVDKDCGDT